MYKIGQKVKFGEAVIMTGYIVGITIDPLEETDVAFESKHCVTYIVRRYKPYLTNGYFDFYRSEGDLRNADD